MSTTRSNLSARMLTALQASSVASAAGVAALTWASVSAPHVFRGFGPYLGGRNRGRLPFIEYDIQSQPFTQETYQGGTVETVIRVTAHVGGRDLEAANNLLDAMIMASLASIRSQSVDNLTAIGSESVGAIEQSPWGHQMSADITVSNSYGRDTYEVQ